MTSVRIEVALYWTALNRDENYSLEK